MLRRLLLVVVVAALMTSSASGVVILQVDFNSNQDSGGDSSTAGDPSLSTAAHNQTGWSSYHANHEVIAEFSTADYGGITVTPAWPNTTNAAVQQSIDRGNQTVSPPAGNDATWNNSLNYLNLVTDFIGTDTRTGNGGLGNWDGTTGTPTYMTLTLGGLSAGLYEWTSFHHDTENVHGPFAVWVSTDGGTTFVQLPDGLGTDGSEGGTPESPDPPGRQTGPDPYTLVSTYTTTFTADGAHDVVMRFAPYSDAAGVHRQIWAMNGFELSALDSPLALGPNPTDTATDVQIPPVLTWTPGSGAAATNGHKVYLSDVLADVQGGLPAADRGVVSAAEFDTAALNLAYGTTYYWRVDESSTPGGPFTVPGNVWSFTTEAYSLPLSGSSITPTASSSASVDEGPEKTVDGSGLTGDLHDNLDTKTMWLSAMTTESTWIQYEFDKVYSLHQMLVWNYNGTAEPSVGFGIKDATIECSTDGTTWTTLGTHQFNRAPIPSTGNYAPGTTIDFAETAAKYVRITAVNNWGGLLPQHGLSEVRFYYVPKRAREPQPDDGSTVGLDTDLGWRPGIGAATHDVYMSTNESAVLDGTAPVVNVATNSYDPGTMQLATTYFWRVDEVNNADVPSTWEGSVWSFSTPDGLMIDDIEIYGDANTPGPPPPAGSRVWYTWKDGAGWTNPQPGYAGNGSGAFIGHGDSPYVETGIVHGGGASLPFYYVNNSTGGPYYSEAVANVSDLAVGSDWTAGGAKSLSLWFYGDVNNVGSATDQLYVKINGVKVSYPGDMSAALKQTFWHEWNIDLAEFAGVNLTNVTTIALGFGNQSNTTTPGGSGIVFFDDIQLYPSRCRAEIGQPGADLNDDCVVNMLDVATMAAQWLTDGHLVTPASPGTASLIGHWEFDGNVDDSAGTAVGSVTGDPVYVTGLVDQAIKLDGVDDFVQIDGDWTLTTYTLGAWFQCEGGSGSREILSMYEAGGGHGVIIEIQSNGTLRFLHRSPVGTGGGTNIYSSDAYVDGMWHYATITKSDDTMTAYIDGEAIGSAADATVFDEPMIHITMGVLKHDNLARYFYGAFDDACLYNQALSADEVAWLAGKTAVFSSSFDTNVDGAVDFKDFSSLTAEWLDEVLWP